MNEENTSDDVCDCPGCQFEKDIHDRMQAIRDQFEPVKPEILSVMNKVKGWIRDQPDEEREGAMVHVLALLALGLEMGDAIGVDVEHMATIVNTLINDCFQHEIALRRMAQTSNGGEMPQA